MISLGFQNNLSIRYNALTKQGQKLADYVKENPSQTVKMTARELGDASGTSASTVVRLCRQLGYGSFEQMKINLARDLSNEELSAPIDTIISRVDSIPNIAQKLFHNQQNALRTTMEMMDYDDIRRSVNLIQKARVIYLFALGSSALAAKELAHRLNRVGKACIFLEDGHTNLEYSSVAREQDLVIAFSYSGETKEVYLAAKHAMENGVPVISVTRENPNTLQQHSSIIISVPDIERRLRVGAFGSVAAQMFVSDVLFMSLIQKDFNKYEDMLLETSRIVNRLRE